MLEMTQKPENRERVEKVLCDHHNSTDFVEGYGKVRAPGQSFWDAIKEADIASMENGEEILKTIKNAGR